MKILGATQAQGPKGREESGFVLVTVLTILIPLVLVVITFAAANLARSKKVNSDLQDERSLLAAESGLDDAIYRGQIGTLPNGTSYTRSLGGGMSFTVMPVYLGSDSADNDGDGSVDEPDEDAFQVVVTGKYRNSQRRIAAYLGPVPLLPALAAPVTMTNRNVKIVLGGSPLISGVNRRMDGTTHTGIKPGMAITPPGLVADLDGELSGSERTKVVGAGGTPSLGVSSTIDVPALVASLQNTANVVLTSDKYHGYAGSSSDPKVMYREGDVAFTGTTTGAGILVVTGDLTITGAFRFDGVIIVSGNISLGGATTIFGAIVQGPGAVNFVSTGTAVVHYSAEAIALANSQSGQYVAFNGWQELAR